MASGKKQTQQYARQLLELSLVNGAVSLERVAGVLAHLERNRPVNVLGILRAYHRLVAGAVARGQAVVEHAGSIHDQALADIAAAMSRRYGRPITGSARRNNALLAGLRVRVGDDVYESSVAGQLAQLAAAV
ncbi:MAG: F0F1 ATP synthase subunit delta [Verrucomicrobia bacterium]|nr:F0F1 ATP synthase subunit delta [Verrucomicrobiota bacterium]